MTEKYSLDFIHDLKLIQGTDAVVDFFYELETEDQKEFALALQKYYETQYWKLKEKNND